MFGDLRPLSFRVPSGSALWSSKCAAIDNLQKHAVLMSTDYSREEQSFPSRAHHTRCFTGHETGFKMPSSSRISGSPALDTDWLPSRAPASSTDLCGLLRRCWWSWMNLCCMSTRLLAHWLEAWLWQVYHRAKAWTTVTETTPNNCNMTSGMVSTCFMLLIYPVFVNVSSAADVISKHQHNLVHCVLRHLCDDF